MDPKQAGELIVEAIGARGRLDSITGELVALDSSIKAGEQKLQALAEVEKGIKVDEASKAALLKEQGEVGKELDRVLGVLEKAGYSTPLAKPNKTTRL